MRLGGFREIAGGALVALLFVVAMLSLPMLTRSSPLNLEGLTLVALGAGATILGSIIAAGASLWVSREQKRDSQITDAHTVIIKARIIHSDFLELKKWIDEAFAKAAKTKLKAPWEKLNPKVGIPNAIEILPRELAFLSEAQQYELLEELILLGMRHSLARESANVYCRLRMELTEKLTPKALPYDPKLPDQHFVELRGQDLHAMQPYFMKLNSLIDGMIANLDENIPFADGVNKRMGPVVQQIFGENKFPPGKQPSRGDLNG